MERSATTNVQKIPALPIDVEDEVSWVVHEFRLQGSPMNSIERSQRGDRAVHTKKRKKTPYQGYFSDVRFHSGRANVSVAGRETQKRRRSSNDRDNLNASSSGPLIEVCYLFDKVLSLTFHVHIRILDHRDGVETGSRNHDDNDFSNNKNNSYTTLVACMNDNDAEPSISCSLSAQQWESLRGCLHSICDVLNCNHRNAAKAFSSSLFAVLSKLLMSLNQLQTEVLESNNKTNSKQYKVENSLLRPLTDRQRSFHLQSLLGEGLSPTFPSGIDLAILMLRCAVLGKHGEIFSRPFPRASDGSPITETIWKATEYHQRFQRRRCRCCQQHPDSSARSRINLKTTANNNNNESNAHSKSPTLLHQTEQELFGFFSSLPWMKRGSITVTRTQDHSEKDSTHVSDGIQFEVCLNLHGKNGDGEHEASRDVSYSPKFARFCREHGVITVFHGTHMENVWSILHNGFFNPSEVGRGGNEFVKNGAMLGSGIYLTTSQKVATLFATSDAPNRKVRSALKHDSMTNLLAMAAGSRELDVGAKDGGSSVAMEGHNAASFFDRYDVSCFPVFEARIIRPPGDKGNKAGHEPTAETSSRQKTKYSNSSRSVDSGSRATRRDGKYYVVPNGRDVRITKLHLTFELTRKKRRATNIKFTEFLSARLLARNAPSIAFAVLGLAVSFAFLWLNAGTSI
jgi:hypothetical protein